MIEPPAPQDVMFYPAGSTMWRTTDVGSASRTSGWTELTGIGNNTANSITALGVSRSGEWPVLYYGTSGGSFYRLNNADSAAAATVPSNVTDGGFPGNAYVSGVVVDPTDADKVMVTFSNYEVKSVFYTSDGGGSWSDVSGDLEENPDGTGDGPSVRSAAILPQPGLDPSQTTYYVGTSTGLYSTTELDGSGTEAPKNPIGARHPELDSGSFR
jgi:hypothetical protein